MEFITVRQFIDGAANGRAVFLHTFNGPQEIGYCRWPDSDPWLVNKNGLASWCVHYGVRLYFSAADAIAAEGRR